MTITNLVLALQIVTTNTAYAYNCNDIHIEREFYEKIEYKVLGAVPNAEPKAGVCINTPHLAKGVHNLFKGIDNAPALIPLGSYHIDESGGIVYDSRYCGVLFKDSMKKTLESYNLFERDRREKRMKEILRDRQRYRMSFNNTEEEL